MIDLESIYVYKCRVKRNYDGDTITVQMDFGYKRKEDDIRIRLFGIDTPEVNRKASKEKGIAARDFVTKRLPKDSTIYCKSKLDKVGSFARKLMIVFYFDKDNNLINLNKELVESGHATLEYVDTIEELS